MRPSPPLLLALLCLFTGACRERPSGENAAKTASISISLLCEQISPSDEDPRYALYAVVKDSKVKLSEISACDKIESDDYADYQIPADALAAAGGWWAGAGDYFYARISDNDELQFFQGQLDEQDVVPNDFAYHLIASFQNGKFSFK